MWTDTFAAVKRRYLGLPAAAHTDDPVTAASRLVPVVDKLAAQAAQGEVSRDCAVLAAALAASLVVAVDRAEEASFTTGEAA